MKKDITYEQAIQRLEFIVRDIEQGSMQIDQLTTQIKEAQQLLKYCKGKLAKVETDVNKLFENE